MSAVLIIGSAPDALGARDMDFSRFGAIVAMNNAWQVRSDWTHLVFPDDFDPARLPKDIKGRTLVRSDVYVPANNAFGGIVYAGGTMAFTTAYWALHALKPLHLAFIGCDMIYDHGDTHFYGRGIADPLRDDPTLQSLEAKSNRLMILAHQVGCTCVNLSEKPSSRLTFPRGRADALEPSHVPAIDMTCVEAAQNMEAKAAQFVESGDYWNADERPDAKKLAAIDKLWLKAVKPTS